MGWFSALWYREYLFLWRDVSAVSESVSFVFKAPLVFNQGELDFCAAKRLRG
jgi:hypothetical protein